jgi:hypothetical protein
VLLAKNRLSRGGRDVVFWTSAKGISRRASDGLIAAKQVLKRLIPAGEENAVGDETDSEAEEVSNAEPAEPIDDDLDVALVAEDLLSDPEPTPETDNIHKAESAEG